ncbi:MAG: hypothetical protein ABNH02_09375 [Pseudomonadales bacterium]|jgi:hypothetical protein
MKYFYLSIFILLSGCTSQSLKDEFADAAIEALTGNDYSRNPSSCLAIKQRCGSNGNHQEWYQEWYQENGMLACACNK